MKKYEKKLPENFIKDKVISSNNNFLMIIMSILSILVMILSIRVISYFERNTSEKITINIFIILIGLVLYIILHEATHGIAYYIETKEKVKFGVKFPVAYCGIPNIYAYKKTCIIAAIAPFIIFSMLFLIVIISCNNSEIRLIFEILFSIHLGGCIGDLYTILLILTKYNNKVILFQDTGKEQIFYIEK